jgi:hypothetical protein
MTTPAAVWVPRPAGGVQRPHLPPGATPFHYTKRHKFWPLAAAAFSSRNMGSYTEQLPAYETNWLKENNSSVIYRLRRRLTLKGLRMAWI